MDGHKDPTPKQTSKRLSLLKFIAADNVEEESSEDEEVMEPAQTLVGLQTAPSEAIDWDAPLSVLVSQLEQEGESAHCSLSLWTVRSLLNSPKYEYEQLLTQKLCICKARAQTCCYKWTDRCLELG